MAEILVIEDDKAIQNLLKIALKQEEHNVNVVGTAREGVDFIVKNIVDLIVLDLGLPDMDGINVVETVRGFSEKIPIIVVSASGRRRERLRAETLFERRTDGAHPLGAAAQLFGGRARLLRKRFSENRLRGAQRVSRRQRGAPYELRV